MCRNIRPLFNFDPPATDAEIHDAALQYVRKISGYKAPSKINEKAFNEGIMDIAKATKKLLDSLQTEAEAKDRDAEIEKRKKLSLKRFGNKII
jgi:hypothetical protein